MAGGQHSIRPVLSMKYASCPTAVVDAPAEVVWRLLTDPARWGDFYDLRITSVEPPGHAVVGQRFMGMTGPSFLRLQARFEYVKIETDPFILGLEIELPFGILVHEEMDCVALNSRQCRVNYHCNFDFPGNWRGVLLRKMIGRKLDSGPADSLSRLKRAAEELYAREMRA
jgi:Polyketide cyclase / dehydrase and lipid transport